MIRILFFYFVLLIFWNVISTSIPSKKIVYKGKKNSYFLHYIEEDEVIAPRIIQKGRWGDQILIENFLKLFNRTSFLNCIDIGANIGTTVIQMIESGCSNVLAVEPIFDDILKKTIVENNLQNRVKLFNKAIGEKTGKAVFEINQKNPGASRKNQLGNIQRSKEVEIVSFDSIINEKIIYDFVKIDIEGDEKYCYRSLLDKMKKGVIRTALIEVHYLDELSSRIISEFIKEKFKFVNCNNLKPFKMNDKIGQSFTVCVYR